jgi:hypothetical protein
MDIRLAVCLWRSGEGGGGIETPLPPHTLAIWSAAFLFTRGISHRPGFCHQADHTPPGHAPSGGHGGSSTFRDPSYRGHAVTQAWATTRHLDTRLPGVTGGQTPPLRGSCRDTSLGDHTPTGQRLPGVTGGQTPSETQVTGVMP